MIEPAPRVALSELAAGAGGKIVALELPPEAKQRLLEQLKQHVRERGDRIVDSPEEA